MRGTIESIHIADSLGAPTYEVQSVEAIAGRGLEGDRKSNDADGPVEPQRQLTLIEAEALEAVARDKGIALTAAESRRNMVTRGVALNHLVGRTFRVGAARALGIELCEPCGHMEKLSGRPGACQALIHRGGLRAEILGGGTVRVGDEVTVD